MHLYRIGIPNLMTHPNPMDANFSKDRERMVQEQIIRRRISDPATLASMRQVPRDVFVPSTLRQYAYDDGPLPIGEGQTISQPYIVALMTQAAELNASSIVLEIGTGSGYAAAILSRIAKEVYTIERIRSLAEVAQHRFLELDYKNVHVKVGDGSLGWPEKGPFDAIIVTAGAPVVPASFLSQLKVGGRVIIPVGNTFTQELLRLRKTEQNTYLQEILELVRFVPLIGKQGWEA
jgi:protein-L-isoaspartate(D-aspartate) O-methyltransferase